MKRYIPALAVLALAALTFSVLLASCSEHEPPEPEPTEPTVHCHDPGPIYGTPSRVIYKETGKAVYPLVVLEPPVGGVFPRLGCAHLASGEIRGLFFNVCVDAMPWWEEIHPYRTQSRQTPYAEGDTIYRPFWGADNPFHP